MENEVFDILLVGSVGILLQSLPTDGERLVLEGVVAPRHLHPPRLEKVSLPKLHPARTMLQRLGREVDTLDLVSSVDVAVRSCYLDLLLSLLRLIRLMKDRSRRWSSPLLERSCSCISRGRLGSRRWRREIEGRRRRSSSRLSRVETRLLPAGSRTSVEHDARTLKQSWAKRSTSKSRIEDGIPSSIRTYELRSDNSTLGRRGCGAEVVVAIAVLAQQAISVARVDIIGIIKKNLAILIVSAVVGVISFISSILLGCK